MHKLAWTKLNQFIRQNHYRTIIVKLKKLFHLGKIMIFQVHIINSIMLDKNVRHNEKLVDYIFLSKKASTRNQKIYNNKRAAPLASKTISDFIYLY